MQFKSHILPILESASGAIYHAANSTLEPLEHLHHKFVRDVGLTSEEAFLKHNLAPLQLLRNIGMLGVPHKVVLGIAHPEFSNLFPWNLAPHHGHGTRLNQRRHSKQLLELCDGRHSNQLGRSLFALVRVYNLLPQAVVEAASVHTFQQQLTKQARDECRLGRAFWSTTFSPRSVR